MPATGTRVDLWFTGDCRLWVWIWVWITNMQKQSVLSSAPVYRLQAGLQACLQSVPGFGVLSAQLLVYSSLREASELLGYRKSLAYLLS